MNLEVDEFWSNSPIKLDSNGGWMESVIVQHIVLYCIISCCCKLYDSTIDSTIEAQTLYSKPTGGVLFSRAPKKKRHGAELKALELFHQLRSGANSMSFGAGEGGGIEVSVGQMTHESGQIIATSHDLTPSGVLVREIPLFQGNLGWWNLSAELCSALFDVHRAHWLNSQELDSRGYCVPGTSALEELAFNCSKEQLSAFTLGQCLLGGAAINLVSAWITMRGGSITLTCGDSAYRIGSTLISEPVVDDEATAPGQRNDDPDGQDLFHQGTSDGKDGGYGLSRVSGDPSSSPGGIFSMKAVQWCGFFFGEWFQTDSPEGQRHGLGCWLGWWQWQERTDAHITRIWTSPREEKANGIRFDPHWFLRPCEDQAKVVFGTHPEQPLPTGKNKGILS